MNKPHRRKRTKRTVYHFAPLAPFVARFRQLLEAAGEKRRPPLRDRTLWLRMSRHELRVGEACLPKWDAIMFDTRTISITRLKKSLSGVHRLQEELQALIQLRQRYPQLSGIHQ